MGRPRQYADDAERKRAARARAKAQENEPLPADEVVPDEPLGEEVASPPPSQVISPEDVGRLATEEATDALSRLLAADESDRRGETGQKRREREERALRYGRFRLAMARGDLVEPLPQEPSRAPAVPISQEGWD